MDIIESNGTEWFTLYSHNAPAERRYWVQRCAGSGPSHAQPGIVGFYAWSLAEAHKRLGARPSSCRSATSMLPCVTAGLRQTAPTGIAPASWPSAARAGRSRQPCACQLATTATSSLRPPTRPTAY